MTCRAASKSRRGGRDPPWMRASPVQSLHAFEDLSFRSSIRRSPINFLGQGLDDVRSASY